MTKENKKEIINLTYKNIDLSINLIYRKRKNITIQIKPSCEISLISPHNISKDILTNLVVEKGDWIIKKIDEYKLNEDIYKEKEFVDNEKFMYLGEEYFLKLIKDDNEKIYIEKQNLIVITKQLEKGYIKDKLKIWYKIQSEKLVLESLINCRDKSEIMMQLIPSKLKVKEQKRRWGTCTSKRAIYINSKISMVKRECIEYILVHEFSHLVHMNHSKDFYDLVKVIMPNYKEYEKWLRENSNKLSL